MIQVHLHTIGKTKELWLKEAIAEYQKRMSHEIQWIVHEYRSNETLEEEVLKEKEVMALDPKGKLESSEAFSERLFGKLSQKTSRWHFVIGGDLGLTEKIRAHAKKYGTLISFSPMTFTHQICRLILIEQIYRAWQIEKKSPYHK